VLHAAPYRPVEDRTRQTSESLLTSSRSCRPLRYGTLFPPRLLCVHGGHESGGHVRYGRAEPASLYGDDEEGREAAQAIGTSADLSSRLVSWRDCKSGCQPGSTAHESWRRKRKGRSPGEDKHGINRAPGGEDDQAMPPYGIAFRRSYQRASPRTRAARAKMREGGETWRDSELEPGRGQHADSRSTTCYGRSNRGRSGHYTTAYSLPACTSLYSYVTHKSREITYLKQP